MFKAARLPFFARLGPRGRVIVLSGLVIAAVGVFLALAGREAADGRAIASHEARIAARLGAAQIPPVALAGEGLNPRQARGLDRALGELASSTSGSVRLWSGDRQAAYAGGRRLGGSQTGIAAALDKALAGRVTSVPVEAGVAGSRGAQLATFVPFRGGPRGRTLGAFEVRRPLSEVEATPHGGFLARYAPLLLGLAALWAAMVALALRSAGPYSREPRELGSHQLDSLTNLPNRSALRELLEHAMITARRADGVVCVMLMDLDRFKEVNDTLGHYNGDMLLKRVGPRLKTVLRDVDTVARLGGDEFAVLMPSLPDEAVTVAAERVVEVFQEPFVLGGLSLELEASVGVALYPEHGNRVDVLLHHADTAMYAAKTARTGFAIYADEQDQGSRRRLALASELRRAIADDEFALKFQPKAHLRTGTISGVEALARWNHPTEGVISPVEFIPIAEQTSQLHALTERILDRALEQLREWQARGFDLTMAVNLSMRNLLDATLADQVARLLHRKSIDPARLELELTEGTLMSDPRRTMEVLSRLKQVGVRLSVDDFGTGYSSLAYLKDFPVDAVKIDKSFVIEMDGGSRNAAIVRSTIDLGRNLGLEVVAEGVETQAAYDELARLGCDYAQGYLLAEPLPAVEVLARVSELQREPLRVGGSAMPDGTVRPLRAVRSGGAF